MLDHAQVDVSFLAGLLVDKFVYHTPLYRQHQRLIDEGIVVSRSTLDKWARDAIALLEPIARAVRLMILAGSRLKVDETPIKAGRTKGANGQGKMKQGWLWPILGEEGDIAFYYAASRAGAVIKEVLGENYQGILQTDGYHVYAKYAAGLPGCTHALCWAHTRRAFLKAENIDPQPVAQALEMIRGLYAIERELRAVGADQGTILARRKTTSGSLPRSPSPSYCHAVRWPRRWGMPRSVSPGCASSLRMPGWRWTRTTWNGRFESFRWARRTGCSAQPSSGLNRWRRSRRCWRPAGLTALMPTPTWSMCCSGSTSIRPAGSENSRPECGPNTSGTTP